MEEYKKIVQATSDLVSQLTDIVGSIDKNMASFDRLKDRYKKKRIKHRLETLLSSLVAYRCMNRETLWIIGEQLGLGVDQFGILETEYEVEGETNYTIDNDLRQFLENILRIKDLLDEYHKDLVTTDYKLYEEIQDAIDARITVLKLLRNPDTKKLSPENLIELYNVYSTLIHNFEEYKSRLDKAISSDHE